MKTFIHITCLLSLLIPVVCIAGEFGIKGGLLGNGELHTSERLPYHSRGTSAGLNFDAFNFTDNYTDKNTTLYEVGVHLKTAIKTQHFDIRPGFGVGYGEMEILNDTSTHLLLQGFVELAFNNVLESGAILTEVGLVTSPSGGISNITFGPMFFYRVGISF